MQVEVMKGLSAWKEQRKCVAVKDETRKTYKQRFTEKGEVNGDTRAKM